MSHPQTLDVASPPDPKKFGEAEAREIGQALDYAIDQARTTKGALASDLKYTDQGVITRWISGSERPQLDRLKALAPRVYVEFLFALLEMESNVTVARTVTMRRVG